jgi:hypothetical protein
VFAYIAIGVFVFVDTPRGVAPATPLTANLRLIYILVSLVLIVLRSGGVEERTKRLLRKDLRARVPAVLSPRRYSTFPDLPSIHSCDVVM